MASIRDLFHTLGSKHTVLIYGCGVIKETIDECLKIEGLSEELKDKLCSIKEDAEQIIKYSLAADKLATEIQERVYAVLDPDTGKSKQEISNA